METICFQMLYPIPLLLLSVNQIASHPQISLEYRPNRPFYHPNPGNYIEQIVQPGKPWPANQEGYQEFSQTTIRPFRPNNNVPGPDQSPQDDNLGFLADRIKEEAVVKPSFSQGSTYEIFVGGPVKPSIILEYKPEGSSFKPEPGMLMKNQYVY